MLDAQIPLPRALEFYNARVSKEDLRKTLQSVAAGVDRGDDNHKAFAATGRFDSTFVGLVKAGTMASNLSAALRALARRMKTNAEFQGKLRKALLTPCGVLVFLWCLLIYSMTGLVPNVEKMLNDMRVEPDAFSAAGVWVQSFFPGRLHSHHHRHDHLFAALLAQSVVSRPDVQAALEPLETASRNRHGFPPTHLPWHVRNVDRKQYPDCRCPGYFRANPEKYAARKRASRSQIKSALGMNLGEAIRKLYDV